MAILPRTSYRYSKIPIKILMLFITEVEKKESLQLIWNHKNPQVAIVILSKINK